MRKTCKIDNIFLMTMDYILFYFLIKEKQLEIFFSMLSAENLSLGFVHSSIDG
jgi:hypothetical protein